MCIIVAKKKNIPMPSDKILKNCFNNNPDGAGIMLASKGQVWGFKGLMTFEAFESKLKQLTKRFGNLDKLTVVMHFRITTHGSSVPENTHPFPMSTSYDDLRALEWTAKQGVAHNGIIYATSHHDDIFVEDVSDTMVFIKRIAAPVAKRAFITKRRDLLDMLYLIADSKLAFIDDKGNLVTAGKFEKKDGVLYSNSTYNVSRYISTNIRSFNKYYYDDIGFDTGSNWRSSITQTKEEKNDIKALTARDYGFKYPLKLPFITEDGIVYSEDDLSSFALNPANDSIYMWDTLNYDWIELYTDYEYAFFSEGDGDTNAH